MGILSSLLDKEKTSKISVANPRDVFNDVLKQLSGSGQTRELKYNIFYQIIAFRGVVDGVGCSTLVANVALALADLGLNVCVIDTNIKDINYGYKLFEKSHYWLIELGDIRLQKENKNNLRHCDCHLWLQHAFMPYITSVLLQYINTA